MVHSFPGVHFNNRQEFFMLLATSLQAVFIGAFISLFTIGSHVLFLQSWVPGNIPQAFIISGVIGILIFSAYSYFNSRVNFRSFILGWLFLLFVCTILLYIFYDTLVDLRVFGIPLMMPFSLNIPVAFLIMLLFRRLPMDIFTPYQHRRFSRNYQDRIYRRNYRRQLCACCCPVYQLGYIAYPGIQLRIHRNCLYIANHH